VQTDAERQELRRQIKDSARNRDAGTAIQCAKKLVDGSNKPADVMFCASALAGIADAIQDQLSARPLRTYIVRSVTVEPILPFLATEATFSNYVLDLELGGYGSYADELLNPQSALANFKPDLVLILLDVDEIAGRLPALCSAGLGAGVEAEIEDSAGRMSQLVRSLRSHSSARILLQGIVVPDHTSLGDVGDANLPKSLPHAVLRLNERLAAICRTVSDCVFFDVDRLAARHGRARWRDARMFLANRLPVSSELFSVYARALVRTFSTMYRAPRKVLCTDLDNTLWGGILGEDGAEGISTGSAFPGNCYFAYQSYLKQLSSRGILLAIVSKNNEADVRDAFRVRSSDLALNLNDFVASKIGWNDKAQSIRELAEELSLGLDAFVLVDDSPQECEAIRRQLPEVAVIQAPVEEPWKLVEILSEQPFFDALSVTEDDVNRLHEYKTQAERAKLEDSAIDRNDFLASLEIVCTFQSALQAPLARAAQLLAKTNQFNLTTRRRSSAEIEEFASVEGGQAVVVRVRDRFGDAGVVGLALARNHDESCIIDSFLLSCRVIGRGIETALLAHISQRAFEMGARQLVGEFIQTKKNALCANFYRDHGFVDRDEKNAGDSGTKFFTLDLNASVPTSPEWIKVEGYESNERSRSPVFTS
jgi:FkbH-like protein